MTAKVIGAALGKATIHNPIHVGIGSKHQRQNPFYLMAECDWISCYQSIQGAFCENARRWNETR
jgi:hypothetical protein